MRRALLEVAVQIWCNVFLQQRKAEGFAFQRPVVSNTNEEGRALNRRVDIIILDEKVENITAGEPANAFESAFAKLKAMVDAGLVKAL